MQIVINSTRVVCTPTNEALIDSFEQDDDGPGTYTLDDASPPLSPAAPETKMAASPASMQARKCALPHCAMRPCEMFVMCAWHPGRDAVAVCP